MELSNIKLSDPHPFIQWLSKEESIFRFSQIETAEVWALTALAALARKERAQRLELIQDRDSKASRFAYALGIDNVIDSITSHNSGEPGRTFKLTRVSRSDQIEISAREISKMIVPDEKNDNTRLVIKYILIELLRNVIQHSYDRLGGVVAAQRMDKGRNSDRPVIQIAVADNGIGIYESLLQFHQDIKDPETALNKALLPHFSGKFEEGKTGSIDNAGMGLFFITELAKLTAGTLVLSSKGATLILDGDPSGPENHKLSIMSPKGIGYPGTLVTFELPIEGVEDYAGLIEKIRERASLYTPSQRINRWFRFDLAHAPEDAIEFVVNLSEENTIKASEFAKNSLIPAITNRKTLILNFQNIQICTQSYAHALLFEPLRMAWALQIPIFVKNVDPAVKSNLNLLENYALSG